MKDKFNRFTNSSLSPGTGSISMTKNFHGYGLLYRIADQLVYSCCGAELCIVKGGLGWPRESNMGDDRLQILDGSRRPGKTAAGEWLMGSREIRDRAQIKEGSRAR
ncbi:unnamed protein product [Dovyalis caffra]|uniref:Uncharacterized protein n=1 Tax=Dovyalis caffra TaxID=77055 RepID=A0AAV1SMB1_9ROSI|nr:unnamed protein product [Dovyalis caffra]